MARSGTLPHARIRELVYHCFHDLSAEADDVGARGSTQSTFNPIEQVVLTEDRLRDLGRQIACRTFDAEVHQLAAHLLAAHGIAIGDVDQASMQALVTGVARAQAEQHRKRLFRLGEPLLPYEPTDPLFRLQAVAEEVVPVQVERPHSVPPSAIGPRLGDLVEKYLMTKGPTWTAKTGKGRKRQLGLLIDQLGTEKRVSEITPDEMRDFRDALMRLRLNHHVGAGKHFTERQTDVAEGRVSAKTASLLLETANSFLRWAKKDRYIRENPAEGLEVPIPKTSKTKKARRPFSRDELVTVFSSLRQTPSRARGPDHL
jgi:hypothetical protein